MTVEKETNGIALKSSTKPAEQVELFSLDGKSYTIERKPRLNVALKTMEISAEKGELAGQAYMLRSLIGDEGYDALLNFEDLTAEDLEAITELASKIVFGDLEAPKENS